MSSKCANTCFLILVAIALAGCAERGFTTHRVVPSPTRSIVLEEDLRFGGDEPAGRSADGRDSGGEAVWRAHPCTVIRTIGREGDRRGEFRNGIGKLVVEGDSVSVFGRKTVKFFDRADGSFRRQYTLPSVDNHTPGDLMNRVGDDMATAATFFCA